MDSQKYHYGPAGGQLRNSLVVVSKVAADRASGLHPSYYPFGTPTPCRLVGTTTYLRQELLVAAALVNPVGDAAKGQVHHQVQVKNTQHALRVANPRAADRPAGGWPPEGRIIMTPITASETLSISVTIN
jgi:hypothetical protein